MIYYGIDLNYFLKIQKYRKQLSGCTFGKNLLSQIDYTVTWYCMKIKKQNIFFFNTSRNKNNMLEKNKHQEKTFFLL